MINGTKLLNVAGMTRGRRDGILKSEKMRHVVKIGPMHLKGVWYERMLEHRIFEMLMVLGFPSSEPWTLRIRKKSRNLSTPCLFTTSAPYCTIRRIPQEPTPSWPPPNGERLIRERNREVCLLDLAPNRPRYTITIR